MASIYPTTAHQNFDALLKKSNWQSVKAPSGWYTDNPNGYIEVGKASTYGIGKVKGVDATVVELESNRGDASNLYTLIQSQNKADVLIAFDYSPRKGHTSGTDSAFQVIVDGKVVDTINSSMVGFQHYSITVPGTGKTMRVEFKALGKDSYGAVLDNISVEQQFRNQAPDAKDDTANGKQDNALVIALSELLKNDKDPDGDKLYDFSVQNAKNGTVELIDGSKVIFTPTAGYSGPASFTYTITDGKGGFDTASVNLTIEKVNKAPDAIDDIASGKQDNALMIAVSELLKNDKDLDGDKLVPLSVQNPTNGTVELIGSEVKFTPNAGYSGPASFTYTVTDGKGGFDTATVNLTIEKVMPVNQAPVAMDDSATGMMNNHLVIAPQELLGNDYDPEDGIDGIHGVGLCNAVNGQVYWDGANVIFVPNDGYTGAASFTYTIADKEGLTSTATVHLTIEGIPPIEGTPQDDALSGTDGNDVILGLAGNDVIDAGAGDDIIQGGQGDDVLIGGAGADTFVWTYNDIQPFGNGPETDIVIADFSDKLDLRDLLQNEQSNDEASIAEGLDNYLHFSSNDEGDTVISVSALGSFADNNQTGFNQDCAYKADQVIIIKGFDLTQGGTISDVQAINTLLAGNHLITDLM
jgi:Ca2+-binding RTX toxin-like protein